MVVGTRDLYQVAVGSELASKFDARKRRCKQQRCRPSWFIPALLVLLLHPLIASPRQLAGYNLRFIKASRKGKDI